MQITHHLQLSQTSGWSSLYKQEQGKSFAVNLTSTNGSIQTSVNKDPKDETHGLFKRQFRESVKVLNTAAGFLCKKDMSTDLKEDLIWANLGLNELFKTCISKSISGISLGEQREIAFTMIRQLGNLNEVYLDKHLSSWTHWADQTVPVLGTLLHTIWNGRLTDWDQYLPSDQKEVKTLWRLARVIKLISEVQVKKG
jgi:hypothetical protein